MSNKIYRFFLFLWGALAVLWLWGARRAEGGLTTSILLLLGVDLKDNAGVTVVEL